jgi:hypothetical protein
LRREQCQAYRRTIGLEGEYSVYRILQSVLGEDFNEKAWTSELRHVAGPDFTIWKPKPWEKDTSDFNYFDDDRKLIDWLVRTGVEVPDIWQEQTPEFHIEVKTTTHSCNEPFHLSRLQKAKAERLGAQREWAVPDEIYVIVRIYRAFTGRMSDRKFYVDLSRLFEKWKLKPGEDGWLVTPA